MYGAAALVFRSGETRIALVRTWSMIPRATLIAVLVGVEIALVVMMIQAITPGMHGSRHVASAGEFHGPVGRSSDSASNYVFTTGGHSHVIVDIDYADLTIERRNTPGITVDVPRHGWHGFGIAPKITAQQDGNEVSVVADSASSMTFDDARMVTIAVAPDTRVTVKNAGNIKAIGLRGASSFYSENGTITIEDFDAPSLSVSSSNGRLTLHNIVAPTFEATSSNGRVEGTALAVRDGRVESSNGRVTLGFSPRTDSTVTAATSNGNISLDGLTASAGAAPKTSADDDDDDGDSAKSQTVRIGAGSGRLDVHASNGNIKLSQEG